jgi:predicted O-methyltransferase YrrM
VVDKTAIDAVRNEVDAECRRRSIPMLGHEKAAWLCRQIQATRPGLVVEVGTAIGYSGLWIAETLANLGEGRLLTFELDPARAAEARSSFQKAGLSRLITQVIGDARKQVAEVKGPIDILFLDGGFANYYPCFLAARDHLRDGALLIADNAGIGAKEMADYLAHIRKHYESRTEWFDTDLAWNPRDAMEISIYRTA